jgi:signal transduction histidine kinase
MKPKRWPSLSPGAILVITLALAGAVFVGGLYLARRDEQIHLAGNRKPIRALGEEMEKELAQLQRLYEKDLRHLASTTLSWTEDPPRISELCHSIVGVVQWSLLHATPAPGGDLHVTVDPASPVDWPHPTFQVKPEGLPSNEMYLSKDDFLQSDSQTWGWITDPGKPLLFWQRADIHTDAIIILLIDPRPLNAAVNAWFAQWATESFAPLRVRDGPLCALQSSDTTLAATGTIPATESDFVLPVRSLFGTWDIAAWDRTVIRTHYDFRTTVTAGFLSLLIVLLGVTAYMQQQRLLVQTAQRVTFINHVSHELRSPLTNILLNLELTRDMLPAAAERPAHRLSLVQEEAHRLRRLVDNVLTFSSVEQGKHRPEKRYSVPDEIIQSALRQFASAFARRSLVVNDEGQVTTPCLLDADAVTQILSNLFSNIEKYVPTGTIDITSSLRSNTLVITVADEGPGIPVREAEHVFQPFERLDGRINEGASGTGLGLSIARDLAIGMGGSLRLVPSRVGASFELRVPTQPVIPAHGAIT